jgi:hypothetical protein
MQEDHPISVAEFSRAVGLIYDSAIDPKRWPEALQEICRVANCAAGMILLHDLNQMSSRLNETWNYSSDSPSCGSWLRTFVTP